MYRGCVKGHWSEHKILDLESTVSQLRQELSAERDARLRLELELRKSNLKIWGIKKDLPDHVDLTQHVSSVLEMELVLNVV